MLTVGLIGKGRWGETIERTLRGIESVQVVNIGRGGDPRGLDGVIVATPSTTHAAVALPYIEKGIPTFIEKPMTTSVADAERLRAAAEKSGASVFVGHIQLYNPAFRAAVSALPQIGTITRMEAEGTSNNPRADASVMWDWLPHHLVMAREIMGCMPDAVSVVAEKGRRVEDSACVTFSFGSIPFISRVNWMTEEKRRTFTIYGSKGTIFFDDTAQKKVKVIVGESVDAPVYDAESPLVRELQAFLTMVRTGATDRPHIGEGLDIVCAIEIAHVAAYDGATLAINL